MAMVTTAATATATVVVVVVTIAATVMATASIATAATLFCSGSRAGVFFELCVCVHMCAYVCMRVWFKASLLPDVCVCVL